MIQDAIERSLKARAHDVCHRRLRSQRRTVGSTDSIVIKGPGEFRTSVVDPGTRLAESINALLQEIIIGLVQLHLDLPEAIAIVGATVDRDHVIVEFSEQDLPATLKHQPTAARLQQCDLLERGTPHNAMKDLVHSVRNEVRRSDPFQFRSVKCRTRVGLRQLCLLYTSPSPRDRTRSRMP